MTRVRIRPSGRVLRPNLPARRRRRSGRGQHQRRRKRSGTDCDGSQRRGTATGNWQQRGDQHQCLQRITIEHRRPPEFPDRLRLRRLTAKPLSLFHSQFYYRTQQNCHINKFSSPFGIKSVNEYARQRADPPQPERRAAEPLPNAILVAKGA